LRQEVGARRACVIDSNCLIGVADPVVLNHVVAGAHKLVSLTATSEFSPFTPAVTGVYFQMDSLQGGWTAAKKNRGGSFTATSPTLKPGLHTLYVYAVDAQDATSVNTGVQSAPLTSAIASYEFLVQ
jgi:hypothetical protein